VSQPRDAGEGIDHNRRLASPLRLKATPPVLRNAPPALGQHTDEVLAEMGIDAQRRAALRDAGVV
jgi:formyl-CoA transferase